MFEANTNANDEANESRLPLDLISSLGIFRHKPLTIPLKLNIYSNLIFSSILKNPTEAQRAIDVENRRMWKLCMDITLCVFQHADTKTICNLLLVCRCFLEIGNSEEIARKISSNKFKYKNFYQPNFFHERALQKNILEMEKNLLPLNSNDVQVKLNRGDKYEQPGNGMNGFVFTKTT